MTKPIKKQNNSYATTDDTPNHVSKSRAGFILSFSPPVIYSCIGTQETRDTCGEPVKAVSR